MIEDFRDSLNEELSGLAEPPLGDLVGTAARRGRSRVRRNRVVGAAAGSVVAVAAVTALLLGPLGAGRVHTPPVAAGGTSTGPTVAPPTAPATAPPTGAAAGPDADASGGPPTEEPVVQPVNVTATAVLAAVLDALPVGKTDHYAVNPPVLGAQVYLNTGRGAGLIRVFVGTSPADLSACGSPSKPGSAERRTCFADRRGQSTIVDTDVEGNCLSSTSVISAREDGTTVHVVLGTCLAWDGTANPPGVPALTVDQAVELAGDPSIGARMDPDFVQVADKRFPALPSFR
ncbi:hypothetical protein OG871_10045 [Kitasatospora sp. NBC_00374]|uniref:hypothetical protein n=1 Tax=Kitasatospora sp. NBC_00374 TaxID=2975964 RepID=UPI0030E2D2DD